MKSELHFLETNPQNDLDLLSITEKKSTSSEKIIVPKKFPQISL